VEDSLFMQKTLDWLTDEIDNHWLDTDEATPELVSCSCRTWSFDALDGTHSILEMGQHFRPFSEHVAEAIIEALNNDVP